MPNPPAQHSGQPPQKIIAQTRTESISFQGPIPPPNILVQYNQIVPGSADRIIAMAEKQLQHRHANTERLIDADIVLQKRGQIFGFILCFVTIAGGFVLLFLGKSITGMVSIITALSALAGAYIYGKKERTSKEKDDRPKRQSQVSAIET